jgi:hypothetical protein
LDAQVDMLRAAAAKGSADLASSMLVAGCAMTRQGFISHGAMKIYASGVPAKPGRGVVDHDTAYLFQQLRQLTGGFATAVYRGRPMKTFYATGNDAQRTADAGAAAWAKLQDQAANLETELRVLRAVHRAPQNYLVLSRVVNAAARVEFLASCERLTLFTAPAPSAEGPDKWSVDVLYVARSPQAAAYGVMHQHLAYLRPRVILACAVGARLEAQPYKAMLARDVLGPALDDVRREHGSANVWEPAAGGINCNVGSAVAALQAVAARAAVAGVACPSFAAPFSVYSAESPPVVGIALTEEGSLQLQLDHARATASTRRGWVKELEGRQQAATTSKERWDIEKTLVSRRKTVARIAEAVLLLERRLDALRAAAAAAAAAAAGAKRRGAKKPRR